MGQYSIITDGFMFYKFSVVKLKFIKCLLEIKKGNLMIALPVSCARDWNRTSTSLRTADFESAASTNSATRAKGLQYYDIPFNCC